MTQRADYPTETINRRLSDASLKALSLGGSAIMERMADLEDLTAGKPAPTQAQIEAAAKAIMKTTYPSAEAQALAALTAAAEAGEGYPLTDPLLRVTLNATIERCAQVAESPTFGKDGKAAADAIRAMKEES